jgi:hypothetical protein
MLILKAPAIIAAVLLMSAVSAKAMEFADRPDLVSRVSIPSTVRSMPSVDHLRRQIDNHVILLPVAAAGTKLADRPRPISNLIHARVARMIFRDRPGRLSVEFSAVSKDSGIRFENRPSQVSNHFDPTATHTAMRFEDRPGDRSGFTSSLSKAPTPLAIRTTRGVESWRSRTGAQHRNVDEIRFTIKTGHTYRQAVLQPRDTSTTSAVLNRAAAAFAVIHDNN